jgi:four helix bundle protein
VQNFRKLKVWEKGHRLTLKVYRITERFPSKEQYGLTSQIRRSSSSIPANIAEGCGRGTRPDFARFLQIAMGSASELEYHLLLAYDLGLLEEGEYLCLNDEVTQIKRMLSSLI